MKALARNTSLAVLAALGVVTLGSFEQPGLSANIVQFPMVVSPGASTCLPHAKGQVTITPGGPRDHMHVVVSGLPKITDFDFFVIQVPNAPFGMSWYQGDIETDSTGVGAGNFVGRFSIETFVVAPGCCCGADYRTHRRKCQSINPPNPDVSSRIVV